MIERKEKIALVTFVSSVSLIVVLLLVTWFNNPTGYAIYGASDSDSISLPVQKSCMDSDGKNYAIQGNVNYCENKECTTKTDLCSGNTLTEWLCENDEVRMDEHLCEFGCDFGNCVNKVTTYIGGGGNTYFISGGGGEETSSTSSQSISQTQHIYDLGTLDSEKSVEVINKDIIKFTLSGMQYTIILQDSSQTQATLAISSLSNPTVINVGNAQTIDLNGDGTSDVSIKVKSINVISNKVKLVLTP